MIQKDKELLLKDLCARLPYGVKIHGVFLNYNKDKDKILYEECDEELNYGHLKRYESLKPYLRPLSSITEEEEKEFVLLTDTMLRYGKNNNLCCLSLDAIQWLLKKHFDFIGLISKGLAIEVTKENNPYKE